MRTLLGSTLLVVALAATPVGCSPDDTAAVLPEGFTPIERSEFAFATPPTWQVRLDEPEDIEVVGEAQVDDSLEAVQAKIGNYEGEVRVAGLAAIDVFRLSSEDFESVDERVIDVAGADDAYLYESTYTGTTTDDPIRQWDVFASADDSSRLVYLSLKAPQSVFDEASMMAILQTLEVRL